MELLLLILTLSMVLALALALGLARGRVALRRDLERVSAIVAEQAGLLEQAAKAEASILERFPEPVILVREDRTACRVNAAARMRFGPDIGAILRHPAVRAAAQHASMDHGTQTADLVLAIPARRDVRATIVWLPDELAERGRFLTLLTDHTRERALERMRADFVANASHELRTPLASLSGFIDTLRGPAADDPSAQQRFLTIMAEQAARMGRLIDDLLCLSRIEITEHQPPTGRVELPELIHEIVRIFEPATAVRNMAIQVVLDPDLPYVSGDAGQLGQVLQNLLDNAIKYGREGATIRLTGRVAAKGDLWPGAPGVVVSVADEGPGIASEHIPRLTERFYRVDTGRSRSVGGTGLGLAIVKHVINRHRGLLRIESELGRGSAFSFWLPAEKEVATAGTPHAGQRSLQALSK
ncbi:MAG: two-component sensor histidine kinase [Acetobacteraceae bacterium]|nr:two-component sensor histidine kinase [Acetobacteraceae bacterium]MBV8524179.1 two-component sensor histidine kinase [Acetobacteraceae bacterium]MBV8591603.1 two-component sensor histidine kinase [Acetobacteraceae bacterium]